MSKIYEQIHVDRKPTGLYAHVGNFRQGKFVKATRPSPLRSYAELRTTEGLAQEHPVMRWRCSHCLAYLKGELDATGQYPRCPQCGHSEERAPESVPEDDKYTMVYASPPDTLSRVVDLQRARTQGLPLPPPAPVQLLRLPPPTPRTIQPFLGNTLDRVVQRQRQLGQRAPDAYASLKIMDAAPCERCHKTSCGCPPKAPDVLGQAAKRAAIRTQQEQDAAMIAYPQLRRGTI